MQEKQCCVCGKESKSGYVVYSEMPTMQSELYKTVESAKNCNSGEIQIAVCENCGAVFNQSFDPAKVVYSAQYDNSQDSSSVFLRHMQDMTCYIFENAKPDPQRVLEIGCGKGTFIKHIANETTARCCGYDPSYIGKERLLNGRLSFYKEYYTGQQADRFDVVILRHVIEHIQNPVKMFSLAREALTEDGVFYLETPALEWILKNNILFDFTYEHCSYFTMETMQGLLSRAGMAVKAWRYSFSEQYLSLVAQKAEKLPALDVSAQLQRLRGSLEAFERKKELQIKRLQAFLERTHAAGGNAFWGAAGKGVMCCNLFDQDRSRIDCVIDINPNKQGGFIPLSAHPIIAPQELKVRRIKRIFVINANYLEEITKLAHEEDPDVQIYNFEELINEGSF